MKKLQFVVFLACFSCFIAILLSVAYSHFTRSISFSPVISLDSPVVDCGDLLKGDVITSEVLVTNTGWSALSILQIKPGCAGCITVQSFPKKPIASGQSGLVVFSLDTKLLSGDIMRSFVIVSNDTKTPVVVVQVKAKVIESSAEPTQLPEK